MVMPDTSEVQSLNKQSGRMQQWALAALLLGAVGIAFAPIFVRVSEAGPTATAFWRIAIAWPMLYLWMHVEDRRQPAAATTARRAKLTLADYRRLSVAGLFFGGDLAIWHLSIHYTSITNSTLLANFAPIFVTLFAWLIWKQRFSRKFVAGLAIAIAGAILLMGDSFQLQGDHLIGDGLGLITAVFYAGYMLSIGKLRQRYTTATIMTWSGVVTCLILAPIALLSGEQLLPDTPYGWAILAGLALISHAGGQSLITFAMARLSPAFSSISLLLQPAIAAFLAWLLLGEALGVLQSIGAGIVLVGILLARSGSR